MFLWRLILAIVIFSVTHTAANKSARKRSKKQSVPRQKSHYFIFMGSPVTDGQNNKGLGMILSSERGATSVKGGYSSSSEEKQYQSKADAYHAKSAPDLAATLQQSSRHEPRNGYSYTEALFTGAPLLNGKPSSESDNRGIKKEHQRTRNNFHAAIEDEKTPQSMSDKTRQQEGTGNNNIHRNDDDSPKEKQQASNVQKQMEIHTEEGVEGIPLDERQKSNDRIFESLKSSEPTKQVSSTGEPGDIPLGDAPEGKLNNAPHQHLNVNPSSFGSSSDANSGGFVKHWESYPKLNSNPTFLQQPPHEPYQGHRLPLEKDSGGQLGDEPAVQDIQREAPSEKIHDSSEHVPESGTRPRENAKEDKSLTEKIGTHASVDESHNFGTESHENLSLGKAGSESFSKGVATYTGKGDASSVTGANSQQQEKGPSAKENNGLDTEGEGHRMSTAFAHGQFTSKPEFIQLEDHRKQFPNGFFHASSGKEPESTSQDALSIPHESHVSSSQGSTGLYNEDTNTKQDTSPGSEHRDLKDLTNGLQAQERNDTVTSIMGNQSDEMFDGHKAPFQGFPHKIITSSSEKEYTQKFITGPSQVTGLSIKESTHKQITHLSHPRFGSDTSNDLVEARPLDLKDDPQMSSQSSFQEGDNSFSNSYRTEQERKYKQGESSAESSQTSRLESATQGFSEPPPLKATSYSSKGSDAMDNKGALSEAPHKTSDDENSLDHNVPIHKEEESFESPQGSAEHTQPDSIMHETNIGEPSRDFKLSHLSIKLPSEDSASKSEPGPPSYAPLEFQVGIPEMTNNMQPANKLPDQQNQRNSKNADSSESRVSEGIRGDSRQEDENQNIVYYVKVAKGLPLLNGGAPYQDEKSQKEQSVNGHQKSQQSENTATEKENLKIHDEKGGGLIGRFYKWRWSPKPVGAPAPRPRPPPYPSLSPSLSPSPSPSPLGGAGAIGGSSVDSTQEQSDSDFEQDALNTHNNFRKVHSAPPMTLDRDLCNQAKGYAQQIANRGTLQHASEAERGKGIGENLAYACSMNGTPLTGKSATEMWYNEVCKPGYNFANGGFSMDTGHFTQVVWKDSVGLGIGQGKATQNGMQCIYVVGRYKQAGNRAGQFQDEVMRGNFNQQYCNSIKDTYGK